MIEFIDKTASKSGTPLNRANMMGLQGFVNGDVVFKSDGSIVETSKIPLADGSYKTITKTTIFADNVITEVMVGETTLTKKTTFLSNGSIKEEII